MTAAAPPTKPLLAPVRATFRAFVRSAIPGLDGLDEPGWAGLEAIVEDALAGRPARMRRQLVVFIRLIDALALARHGRRFHALDDARRARLLGRIENAPVLLLRRGFWGLRTLAYMGWYARPETGRALGYRGHVRGWTARPEAAPSVPLGPVPPAHEVGPL